MKKLIVVVASLLVAVSAYAQFGVVAGVTSSKSDIKSAIADVNNITQYHVGVTYKMSLGAFAIQPSILYNMKGTKMNIAELSSTELDYKTGYIEIPVQLQLGLNLGLARLYGFAEPFIGYAITNAATLSGQDLKADWNNVKNRLEYGVGLGAGVELIKHVQVSVRYFWNLGDMYGVELKDIIPTATATIGSSKASGIAASVALLF
jgi:hypothetical protein